MKNFYLLVILFFSTAAISYSYCGGCDHDSGKGDDSQSSSGGPGGTSAALDPASAAYAACGAQCPTHEAMCLAACFRGFNLPPAGMTPDLNPLGNAGEQLTVVDGNSKAPGQ